MRVTSTSVALGLVLTLPAPTTPAAVSLPRALLDEYCVACHNDRARQAGLSLETIDADQIGQIHEDVEAWEKVAKKLRARAMPPPGRPRPDDAVYDSVASSLEVSLDRAAAADPDPGRPPTHRLNRVEYGNAVRDLLALEIDERELLPADESGHGFDNISDVLALSPVLLDRYYGGGGEGQSGSGWESVDRSERREIHGPLYEVAGGSHERGPALRFARRPRRSASLSPGWGVCREAVAPASVWQPHPRSR